MKWIILGAGRSGIGAQKLLQFHNQDVYLFDEKISHLTSPSDLKIINDRNDPIFLERELKFIISPGFPPDHQVASRAHQLHQEIITEIDLALSFFKGDLIAVTGTNGKSTTVMMIVHLFKQLGLDFSFGGNIGIAASSLMLETHRYVVLELSSYQIELSKKLRPKIAILTGLTPDHLARHKTVENYLAAKWLLFADQKSSDLAIIERDAYNRAMSYGFNKPKAQLILIDSQDIDKLKNLTHFRWPHDKINALFALTAARHLSGKSFDELSSLMANYKGLAYRCQVIANLKGYDIINDSKSTTLDSTLHALVGTSGKIILFLGGLGKGESFIPILQHKNKIAKIIAFGHSGPTVFNELKDSIPTLLYGTLKQALSELHVFLKDNQGDILFSPAGASQDEFSDFEERGFFFTTQVHLFLKNNYGEKTHAPILDIEKS